MYYFDCLALHNSGYVQVCIVQFSRQQGCTTETRYYRVSIRIKNIVEEKKKTIRRRNLSSTVISERSNDV